MSDSRLTHHTLQEAEFRPLLLKMKTEAGAIAVLLCNDRSGSFGAPDVLEAALDRVSVRYSMERRLSDRPPDQACPLSFWRVITGLFVG